MQHSNNAVVTTSVRVYDGHSEALLLLTTQDKEISKALVDIFTIHDAQETDPEKSLPWDEPDVGDCRIGNDGVLLTIQGSGSSFMGMRHEVKWGRTSAEWHGHAERRGRVWLGLVGVPDYVRLSQGGWTERLPMMRMLKLEVTS